jgi:hypothetical protein
MGRREPADKIQAVADTGSAQEEHSQRASVVRAEQRSEGLDGPGSGVSRSRAVVWHLQVALVRLLSAHHLITSGQAHHQAS